METEALLYKSFIAKGLRVMIYSGDVDACLPYTGTEEWIHALDLPTVEAWRPWTLDNATQVYKNEKTHLFCDAIFYT